MDKGALRGEPASAGAGTVFALQPDSNAVSGKWRMARRRLRVRAAAVVGAAAAGIAVRGQSPTGDACGRPQRKAR